MTTKWWRSFWLVMLITSDIAMLVCWWIVNKFFFWVFVWINIGVLVGEIVSVIVTGKTLSTNTTNTLEAGGWKRYVGYAAIILLNFAIMSLGLHLGWL